MLCYWGKILYSHGASLYKMLFFTYIDMYVCELDDIQCNTPTDRLLYQLIYFSPVLDDLAVIA